MTTPAKDSEANTSPSAVNQTDVLEERLIDAEYKIWKKNTPFLYDFVMTHSLEWPSLTTQWLPKVHNSSPHASEHSLLLGTHTTGEQNYLMLASVALPVEEEAIADGEDSKKPPPRYDEEKKEMGGFGLANSNVGKIEIKMKVKHEGEVNRARYMPQNHFVVASRGPSSEVYIFDLSKHPSIPSDNSPFTPQGVCVGHEKEGYGLVWSPHTAGLLCTCSEDTTVKLWDINESIATGASSGTQIKAKMTFAGHTATVEDVDWHRKDPNMICSVGDDKQLLVWDTRKTSPVQKKENAHEKDINCVSFNPSNEHLLATGSADHDIAVWDLRNMNTRMHTLKGHTNEVYMVDWAPHCESVLGSCSSDRRVGIWDLSRIGAEQSPEDAEDGPPELLFLHGGHTFKVSDFSWNEKDPWTIASVAEDNILQVWNMAEEIYALDDEELQSSGEGEDGLGDDELE